jgi:hypothetical protein
VEREPEARETSAAGPFLTIGPVSVWSRGNERFRIESPAGDEEVEGFEEAHRTADELAAGA